MMLFHHKIDIFYSYGTGDLADLFNCLQLEGCGSQSKSEEDADDIVTSL